MPVIREMQRRGYSIRGIAVELKKRKVPHRAVAHGTHSSSSGSYTGSMLIRRRKREQTSNGRV